jgi:DNA-directed RNA polymerase sigma subunit (sigma70/sigma32)
MAAGPELRAKWRALRIAREDEAARLRAEGLTLREIGERMGVTRGRIGQMLWHQMRRDAAREAELRF